jgi:predicted phosphodiesterase
MEHKMKILFFSDLHASMKHGLFGLSFIEQVKKTLSWIAQTVEQHDIEYVFCLGDIFDIQQAVDTPSIDTVVAGFQEIVEAARVKVVVVQGNHDVYRKDGLWSSVSALRDIRGTSSSHRKIPLQLVQRTETVSLTEGAVQCVPFTEKGYEPDPQARFICGHLELAGAYYMPGGLVEDQGVHSGFDSFSKCATCSGQGHLAFPEMGPCPDCNGTIHYVGGHYHHPQVLGRALVVGSCCYHSYQDRIVETPRGAVILDLNHDGPPVIGDFTWIMNPHATPVHTIEAQTHAQAEENIKYLHKACGIDPEKWHLRVKIPVAEGEHIDGRRIPRGLKYSVVPDDPPKIVARTKITSKTEPTEAFDEYVKQVPPQKLPEAVVAEGHRLLREIQKVQDAESATTGP